MPKTLDLPHDALARMEMFRQSTESQPSANGSGRQSSRTPDSESVLGCKSRSRGEQCHIPDDAATAALAEAELVLVDLSNARERVA